MPGSERVRHSWISGKSSQTPVLPAELSTVFNPESLRVHWSCLLAIISLLVYYGAGSVYNRLDGYYQVDWAAAESKHTIEFPHYDSVLKTLNRCLVQK